MMKRIQIICTEHETKMIKEALTDTCIFKGGTVKNCGEESCCNECIDENIEFNILESEDK